MTSKKKELFEFTKKSHKQLTDVTIKQSSLCAVAPSDASQKSTTPDNFAKTSSELTDRSPLFLAIQEGKLYKVKRLLKKGATLNTPDFTPLMVACFYGHQHIAEYLLNCGDQGHIEDRDIYGNTALIDACWNGHLEVAEWLIGLGAELNTLNIHGDSALYTALRFQHKAVADYLLSLEEVNQDGVNVLGYDAFVVAVFNGFLCIADKLWVDGIDLNRSFTEKNTLLHMCAMSNNEDSIHWLLHHGANHTLKNAHGMSPLVVAASRGFDNLVPVFLQQYTNINQCYRDMSFALIAASNEGHDNVVKAILAFRDTLKRQKGFSNLIINYTLMNCVTKGYLPILERLLNDEPQKVKSRINKHYHYSKHVPFNHNASLLLASVDYGNLEIATKLVEWGANTQTKNHNHDTILHLAVRSGHLALVQWACRQKININSVNKAGNTALHYAAEEKNADIIRCLLDYGANPALPNKLKQTPLFLVRHQPHLKACFDNFASGILTNFGYTLLHEAAANGQEKTVLQLLPGLSIDAEENEQVGQVTALSKNGLTPLEVSLNRGLFLPAAAFLLWESKGSQREAVQRAFTLLGQYHCKSPATKTLLLAIEGIISMPDHRLQGIQHFFERDDINRKQYRLSSHSLFSTGPAASQASEQTELSEQEALSVS